MSDDFDIAAFEAHLQTAASRPRQRTAVIRESDVEASRMAEVKAAGGASYKFVSPSRRAVPDRLNLMPIPPEHRELVARYVRFAEYKRPGERPTPAQEREHARLRTLGLAVDVIDSLAPRSTPR